MIKENAIDYYYTMFRVRFGIVSNVSVYIYMFVASYVYICPFSYALSVDAECALVSTGGRDLR